MNLGFSLEVDSEKLNNMIDAMKGVMKPQQFENAMAGVFRKTGSEVKRILREELPKDYKIPRPEISRAVKSAKITSAGGTGCVIPIKDMRRKLGGRATARTFGSNGSGKGIETFPVKNGGRGKKYRVTAKVYNGPMGVLPRVLPSYGGQPPFRNTLAPSLNNLVYTRATEKRLPIKRVAAIAIPQMPLNKSEVEVQERITTYLENKMEDRFLAMLKIGK